MKDVFLFFERMVSVNFVISHGQNSGTVVCHGFDLRLGAFVCTCMRVLTASEWILSGFA